MCKVSSVTKVTDKNRSKVWAFMRVLGNIMTKGNSDGLGYAAFDKSGKLFGERWLINNFAFRDFSQLTGMTQTEAERIYNSFGEVKRDEAQAIILHTRFATCEKGIKNTHPFIDDIDDPTVAIIHNGIIYNHRKFLSKYSTCDSEVLAHIYKEHETAKDIKNIHKFVHSLDGWFTVINLSTDDENKMVMDLYTDTGRLASYFLPELDVRVYATSKTDIEEAAHMFNLKLLHCLQYKPNTMFRVDVKSGQITTSDKWVNKPTIVHPEVVTMNGNFDDDSWVKEWLKGGYRGDWSSRGD